MNKFATTSTVALPENMKKLIYREFDVIFFSVCANFNMSFTHQCEPSKTTMGLTVNNLFILLVLAFQWEWRRKNHGKSDSNKMRYATKWDWWLFRWECVFFAHLSDVLSRLIRWQCVESAKWNTENEVRQWYRTVL